MTGEAGGSGTWYLAIMHKTSIFYEDFVRVYTFVLAPNPKPVNPLSAFYSPFIFPQSKSVTV